jgi:hypothetical protein
MPANHHATIKPQRILALHCQLITSQQPQNRPVGVWMIINNYKRCGYDKNVFNITTSRNQYEHCRE